MAVYTVHAPVGGPDAEAVFVRDRFSWSAFAFGPFWLAWRRLWLALALWLAAAALFGVVLWLARPSAAAATFAIALGQVFLGLEAQGLARDRLARRGLGLVDVVVGERLEDVETLFYRRRSQRWAGGMTKREAA